MTPEEEIKQFALKQGAGLVGIASVADINRYAPAGHRPDDILVGAESAVVVAGNQVTQGTWHSPDIQAFPPNFDFVRTRGSITLSLARFIETNYGYYALANVPAPIGLNPSLSFKLCAEMAGLGTRSMTTVVLNHDLGFINLAVCLTTMPLKADGPLAEAVCPAPFCVKQWQRRHTTPCLEACPECLSGEIEDGRIKWMRFDRITCSARPRNLSTVSFQRLLMEVAREPDEEKRRSMLLGSFAQSAFESASAGAGIGQCGECLRNCPVCMRARTLRPRAGGQTDV